DDGNRTDGDGCSALCVREHTYDGGGDDPNDGCTLDWAVEGSPAGAFVTCQGGVAPRDRGAGSGRGTFLVLFCFHAAPLVGGGPTATGPTRQRPRRVVPGYLLGPNLARGRGAERDHRRVHDHADALGRRFRNPPRQLAARSVPEHHAGRHAADECGAHLRIVPADRAHGPACLASDSGGGGQLAHPSGGGPRYPDVQLRAVRRSSGGRSASRSTSARLAASHASYSGPSQARWSPRRTWSALRWYRHAFRRFSRAQSRCRTTRAGIPTTIEAGGTTVPSFTNAPPATTDPRPLST